MRGKGRERAKEEIENEANGKKKRKKWKRIKRESMEKKALEGEGRRQG